MSLENLDRQTNQGGSGPTGTVIKHRVYMLPAEFWRQKRALRSTPHRPNQTLGTLVQLAPVRNASSRALVERIVDLDCAGVESLLGDPRDRVGSLVEGPAHVEPAGRAARLQARCPKALKLAWLLLTGRYRFETR